MKVDGSQVADLNLMDISIIHHPQLPVAMAVETVKVGPAETGSDT